MLYLTPNSCVRYDNTNQDHSESERIYNTKEQCEVRYNCVNGNCIQQANGRYSMKRQCERACIEDLNNDENINRVFLYLIKMYLIYQNLI